MGSTTHDVSISQKVLICLCGECAHWEVVFSPMGDIPPSNLDPTPIKLRCMTCKKEFEAKIEIPPSDHLAWATPKEVKVE